MIGELLPDQPDLDNPGMLKAQNVVPYAQGYRPVRNLVSKTNSLKHPCRGAAALTDETGNTFNYAGDQAQIYSRTGNDYTQLGANDQYDLSGTVDRWEFGRWYGKVLAVNGTNRVQYGDFNVALADAAVDAPIAKHMAVASNFVMVGNLTANQNGDADASGVSWAALGDPTNWATAESGYQHLDGAGVVTKILGGEYFTIMMTDGIYRAMPVGPPAHFQFDLVAPHRPAPYPGAIVQVGYQVYFLSYDGFYMFDGNVATAISSGKLSQTFFADFDRDSAHLMTSEADIENNLVYFAYPGVGHDGVNCNRAYCFNYETGIWTGPITQDVQEMVYSVTPATTSDQVPPGDDLCDDWPTTYCDDVQFAGGNDPSLGAFIPDNSFGIPDGKPKTAVLESGEFAHNRGGYAYVTGFRPYVDGASPTVRAAIHFRNFTSGPVKTNPLKLINTRTGSVDQRANARYHRYSIEVSGEYTSIHGGEPNLVQAGAR